MEKNMSHGAKECKNRNIMKNQDGVVLIMFGLLINIMVLSVSLSMDLGRGYMARSAIGSAADAAVLAAALQGGDVAEAQRYFEANLPSGYLSIGYDFGSDVSVTVENGIVRVVPSGFEVPGFFNTNVAAAGAGANLNVGGGSAAALPNQAVQLAHFALILDGSGSMGGSKIVGLRTAVSSLLTLLDGANQNTGGGDPLLMSMAVYSTTLRGHIPPTSNISSLQSFATANLTASGTTNGHVAANIVRVNHLSQFPAGQNKNVVLMTDGNFNRWGLGNPSSTGTQSHTKVREECDFMKQDPDVSVWTIGFGSGASSSTGTLNYCASSPDQALWASSNQELVDQFNSIFSSGTNIRLVE